MENINDQSTIIQKQEQCILNQDGLITQMKEVISTQKQKLKVLEELNQQLMDENAFLKKHNKEILDTVHLMLEEK